MPIEYAENDIQLPDGRIEKAMDWLLTYQRTLRALFDALPQHEQMRLARVPNPHLASGPMDIYVCQNGVMATIKNGLSGGQITANVIIVNEGPTRTIVEEFNARAQHLFTFMDPMSKLQSQGYCARFANHLTYTGNLVLVLIMDSDNRSWIPPASKVFLIGWDYLECVSAANGPEVAANESLAQAHGVMHLESLHNARRLLSEYRYLLASAKNEDALQHFLETYPQFIYPEYTECLSKPSLAGERQPDFGYQIQTSLGPRWVFVEIERPQKLIFTKAAEFQFTHEFTQAKGQLLQWDNLILRDLPFFSRRFNGLLRPEFHLVYGRDAELDAARREMLSAEFSSTSNRTFSTFDDLAHRFEMIISRVFAPRHQKG
ncbi:MAG: DUF4263 domain-containing protein [Bryobacterales bacterium]|nr:DUF4263 domain-containing protein [Bryobacterales bacterium]